MKLPTLPGSTAATVQKDSGKPTKDDYNWRVQLDGLLRKNSFLSSPGSANQLLASDSTKPGWEDLTALLDAVFGSDQGSILYRDASEWKVLAPGTAGQVLESGGPSANPSWVDGASKTQTFMFSGFYYVAALDPAVIIPRVPFACTLKSMTTWLSQGTMQQTLKINSTAVTGGTINSSTTVTTETLTANNACSVGDKVQLSLVTQNLAQYFFWCIEYQRVLA